jgi:hypothetical protein
LLVKVATVSAGITNVAESDPGFLITPVGVEIVTAPLVEFQNV